MDLMEKLEKGIVIEVGDVKQAISVDKIVDAILIRNFDLSVIDEVIDAVSIPVIASCRIGHFIEAKILEKLGVSMIDESNPSNLPYMDTKKFNIPFMRMTKDGKINEADIIRTDFGMVDEVAGIVKELKEKTDMKIFASLKIATPADIALLFQMGCNGIIISSMAFRSPNPPKLIDTIMKSARYYNEIDKIVEISRDIDKILPTGAK